MRLHIPLESTLGCVTPTDDLFCLKQWDQSPVNISRIDFSHFLPLKAKIDSITFSCKLDDLNPASLNEIKSKFKGCRLEIPTDRRKWGGRMVPWLAIHDPGLRDLRYLVERFWNSRILYIEFAVDAHLPHGSNELFRLDILKAQLRHCLCPQNHLRLRNATRKYFSIPLNKYKRDGLDTTLPATQIIWEDGFVDDQFALYIKVQDNDQIIAQPWVRMEMRLEGSGCSQAGLSRVGMLPHFAKDLRRKLAPMFATGCGFKNASSLAGRGVPSDPWSIWGSQWGADGKAIVRPDVEANRLIGEALNELRSSLITLKPPSEVAGQYEEWVDEFALTLNLLYKTTFRDSAESLGH